MSIKLTVGMLHAQFEASRRESVERMVKKIGVTNLRDHWADFEIFGDFYARGIWWNAKRAWQWGASHRVNTHHMVIQDDLILCDNFAEAVVSVVGEVPDKMVSLFYGPRKGFKDNSGRWGVAESPWGQAIVMPKKMVQDFLAWDAKNIKPTLKYDDARIALFCVKNSIHCHVPFPNLVNHLDDTSTVGNCRNGRRVSIDFLGDRDHKDFDWSDKSNPRKAMQSLTRYYKYLVNENIS
ncbi:MAG: hypothetical protein CMI54_02335 [Parcubacteria group bacterium]|nr:hypothetical protein [Parcubacteria group bacterium]|tara:strand:- start:2841 stop:3551 length:711 start_codon:yes stop_codon:yes gene_type:complete